MWIKCLHNYLMEEIKVINPKLIIFQGWSSYKYLMDYLEKNKIITSRKIILENVELINKQYYREEASYSKKSLNYNPFYGKFPFNGKQIHFFIIFHQTNFTRYNNRYNRDDYIKRHLKFVKDKILAEGLNIN